MTEKQRGKGRVSPEEYDYRLSETAKLLVRRRGYLDVERELAKKFNVDMRTCRKWIRAVKERWRQDASTEDADESRADLIAQLDAVLTQAWNHAEPIKNGAGEIVLDEAEFLPDGQRNPGYKKPLMRPAARIQHILHAVSQLRALKGADKPVKQHLELSGDINAMPDVSVLPDAVAEALRKALTEGAPGGSLHALAGEWFKKPDPDEAK